jgi:hypothetical protein
MLNSPGADVRFDDVRFNYARSLITAMITLVDDYQRMTPRTPDSFQWSGEAKLRYGERLADFIETLWATRAELDEAKFYLEAAIVP